MSRVEYRMSPDDLRTFDRWHARGAMVLAAALLLMPWMLGIGPNSVRPADGGATAAASDPRAPAPAPAPAAPPPAQSGAASGG